MILIALVGCRTEDEVTGPETRDTQGLEIGDVDAMAEAWCEVLACRDGFYKTFSSKEECTEFYSNYWGNPLWDNNQRECFEDIDATEACTAALEATACGDETPAECVDFMACDDPDDTGSQ